MIYQSVLGDLYLKKLAKKLLELNNLYLDEKLQHTPRKNINVISNVDQIILKISKIDE